MYLNRSKLLTAITIVFIIVSVSLCFIISYIIIDNLVSLKYEVDEDMTDYISKEWARGYLVSKITCLKYFICYILVSIILILLNRVHKE